MNPSDPPLPEPGSPANSSDLLPFVYTELRRLAAFKMASEPPGHTLQPTALVHEAWLRLAGTSFPMSIGYALKHEMSYDNSLTARLEA